MSVEHRRQLLAFFIVALAAVLMIGNGLNNQALRDAINGGSTSQAAIASGVSLVPGQAGAELGGSARGTTAIESGSSAAKAGSRTYRPGKRPGKSHGSSAQGAAVDQSDRTPNARKAGATTRSHGPKRVGKSPSIAARTSDARLADDGKQVHTKRAHGKKADGKKAHARTSGKSRRSAG